MSRTLTGPRFVTEALRGHARIDKLWVRKGFEDEDLRNAADRAGVVITEVGADELSAKAQGRQHRGVVALAQDYRYVDLEDIMVQATTPPLLLALDEISDPQNMGAILRSAVAFGVDGVVVPKRRSAPVSDAVVRASAGASEHARIAEVTNLQRTLQLLQRQQLEVVGLDTGGSLTIDALEPVPAGRILVVGSEGRGLRRLVRERCDILVRIEQRGPVESLNASVAAAIAIYELSKKR